MFNIYKNDQLLHNGIRNFVYADDLCVTAQYTSFTEVEHTIEEALDELTTYYRSNSLRAKEMISYCSINKISTLNINIHI